MGSAGRLLVATALAIGMALLLPTTARASTHWVAGLTASNAGEGKAQVLPGTPGGVTASCPAPTTSKTIKVSWSSVGAAATYSVYDSTTSATGTYSLVASGVGATSWTSGTLANNHFWFEVLAAVGTQWSSARSSATAQTTIHGANPFCTQP